MSTNTGSILVVDDDMLNRMLLTTSLEGSGHRVKTAANGREALQMLHQEPFDVVILDLLMPEMDGYEVLATMQGDLNLRHIPTLIISAMDDMESIIRCIEMGATDYLPKPFDLVLLRARINASFNSKRVRDMEQAYTRELQERNAELDAFASTVAHDLKTPLTPVIGMAELLKKNYGEQLDERGNFLIERIIKSGQKMSHIIEALLLLSALRRQQPESKPLNMAEIVGEVMDRLQDMTSEYSGSVVLPDSWPTSVGYAPWIEEVWTNYISNAFKYGGTPPQATIGATLRDNGTVRFWVKDNGPGIPTEKQKQLFTPFTRLEQERAEGHGLGLSIVERIVTKLGGQVGVISAEGSGSMFWFTLPAA